MKTAQVRRINVFSKQTQKSKYFKIMEIYYQVVHVICFLDFGFFEHKTNTQKIFWKSVSIIKTIVFCCCTLLSLDIKSSFFSNYGILYCLFLFIYYFFSVLILVLINPNETFYNLFNELHKIDFNMKINNSSYNLELKILLFNFSHLAYKALTRTIGGIYSKAMTPFDIINTWLTTCMHLVLIAHALAFYAINFRLKELALILKNTSSNFFFTQLLYKSISQLCDRYKTAFDPLFIIALLFNIPQTMGNVYLTIESYFDESISEISLGMVLLYLIVVERMVVLFSPAICASMLTTQAEQIKLILHDKLLLVRDPSRVREIERFIGYVETHNFRYSAYKVIPLNADLPGMVLSFCITYIIVIVQFTNK